MSRSESFVALMSGLRAEDPGAAEEVFHRYARRLIALARVRLGRALRPKVDPEDVLQSVYQSFFRRQRDGDFAFENWDSLWALLVLMTVRKCCRQAERFRAARRDARREVTTHESSEGPIQLAAHEPTPAEAALLADAVEDLLRNLEPRDRAIVSLRLQGSSVAEIAAEIGRTRRTVSRVLDWAKGRLRAEWGDVELAG